MLMVAHAALAQQQGVPFQEQNEELQGTIYIVEPQSGLLILEKNSVTCSFRITPSTRILVNNQAGNLEALEASGDAGS